MFDRQRFILAQASKHLSDLVCASLPRSAAVTCTAILQGLHRWLYAAKPTRLVFARSWANYHLSRADRARDTGNWAEAADHYQHCLQVLTHRHDLWIQLGNMRKEVGDLQGSRTAYEAALALAVDDSDLALQLGHLTKILGHVDEARTWYHRALALDSRNQNAFEELVALGEDLHTLSALLAPAPGAAPGTTRHRP